jgi:hypothetical protein
MRFRVRFAGEIVLAASSIEDALRQAEKMAGSAIADVTREQ